MSIENELKAMTANTRALLDRTERAGQTLLIKPARPASPADVQLVKRLTQVLSEPMSGRLITRETGVNGDDLIRVYTPECSFQFKLASPEVVTVESMADSLLRGYAWLVAQEQGRANAATELHQAVRRELETIMKRMATVEQDRFAWATYAHMLEQFAERSHKFKPATRKGAFHKVRKNAPDKLYV